MADTAALYKRGEEAFAKKNYDYARDLFLNILALDPNHEKARKSLYAVCVRKLQEQGTKNKITGMFLKGKIEIQLSATKDPAKKIDMALKHLCDEPNDSKVRTAMAQALMDLGHVIGAGAEAEIALQVDGKNLPCAKILVSSLAERGEIQKAQDILDRVAVHAGSDRDISKLQRDLAAKQTMKRGFEEAKDFHDVIKNKDSAAILEIQHHTIQTEEQLQQLMKIYQEQMAANPTDPRIPKRVGDLIFDKKKDYSEARDWYKKASALAPQDTVMRDKVDDCSIRLYDGQVEAAQKNSDPKLAQLRVERLQFYIKSYERRVSDRPTDMGLRYELGKAYYLAGPNFVDKSITEFQQSVRDPKKKMESHIFLGKCFQKKKNFAMADGQYQKAEESGIIAQLTQLDIWYNRAICCFEAGKKDQAIALANKIIEIDINYKDINQLLEKWQNGS